MNTECLWPSDQVGSIYQWNAVAGKLGAAFPLPRPVLIAVRGVKLFGKESHELVHAPLYDDSFCFIVPGEVPFLFEGATHAYQRNSTASPDEDGDMMGDVGSVRPGRYLLNDTNNGVEVVFHITTPNGNDALPAWRDFDHDGKLSPAEMKKSEELKLGKQVSSVGAVAKSILFHGGIDEPPLPGGVPPQHRYSIGCFTAPRKYRSIVSEKARRFGGKVDLFLVEAETLVEIVKGLPSYREGQENQA